MDTQGFHFEEMYENSSHMEIIKQSTLSYSDILKKGIREASDNYENRKLKKFQVFKLDSATIAAAVKEGRAYDGDELVLEPGRAKQVYQPGNPTKLVNQQEAARKAEFLSLSTEFAGVEIEVFKRESIGFKKVFDGQSIIHRNPFELLSMDDFEECVESFSEQKGMECLWNRLNVPNYNLISVGRKSSRKGHKRPYQGDKKTIIRDDIKQILKSCVTRTPRDLPKKIANRYTAIAHQLANNIPIQETLKRYESRSRDYWVKKKEKFSGKITIRSRSRRKNPIPQGKIIVRCDKDYITRF